MIQCPCCSARIAAESIYRQDHCPVMNNVTYPTEEEAVAAVVGTVDLNLCPACGAVFNRAFDARILDYGHAYDNCRSSSPTYMGYLGELTDKVAAGIGPESTILEVGCGNGDFLSLLCEKTRASGYGYDAAFSGEHLRGTARFYKEYFVPSASRRRHDVFLLRHVLEHIGNPSGFLRDMCRPEVISRGARIFVEVPDLDWTVRQGAFYDITYEHCNYLTKDSLPALAASMGLERITTSNVFGGQYLFLEAVYEGSGIKGSPPGAPKLQRNLRELFEAAIERYRKTVREARTVCIWGAAGKGVQFLASLGEDLVDRVEYVVDINKNKQGRYLPVSGKGVQPPEALRKAKGCVDVIIMNEVYRQEIETALQAMGVVARVHVC